MAAKNMDDITRSFKKLKFKKKLIGGVDQRDVWVQLRNIQNDYRSAYEAQEEHYKALIQERELMIRKLRKSLGDRYR